MGGSGAHAAYGLATAHQGAFGKVAGAPVT